MATRIGTERTCAWANRRVDALLLFRHNDRAATWKAIIVIRTGLREYRAYRADWVVDKVTRRN